MPNDLYKTLQRHPCRPETIQNLRLEIPDHIRPATVAPNLHTTRNETMASRTTVKHLTLSRYSFPPQPCGLQSYIDFTNLTTLDLRHCRDIGYLFNNLLCNIPQCRIRDLKIDQACFTQQSPGYLGLEKIGAFLHLHKGLGSFEVNDTDGDLLPQLTAAQGGTLAK